LEIIMSTSTSTQTPTQSLAAFALRVSLTVTKPQLTAKDDKATADAETANNAAGAGQYRKDLYPKHLIAPISQIETAARAYITAHTLDGILPTARFMDFAAAIAPYEVQFNQAVTVFLNNHVKVLSEAQRTQGALFDPSLYPDLTEMRQRFSWRLRYSPCADHSKFADILAPMECAAQALLTDAIREQVAEEQTSLTLNALNKLRDSVGLLCSASQREDRAVVNKKTGGIDVRPPRIRSAVVDNITEAAALIDSYAQALPPTVPQLVDRARILAATGVQCLKENPEARKVTHAASALLLADIDEMMGVTKPAPEPVSNSVELAATPEPTPAPTTEQPTQPVLDALSDALADFY